MITHIWQSTLFAGAAGLLTLLLRRDRARTRYWVWLAGLVKFLVPFGLLVSLGGHINLPRWTPKAPAIVEPAISFVMGRDIGEPALTTALAAPPTSNDHLPMILLVVWACGFVAIVFCWVRRWLRVQCEVRDASPLPIEIGIPAVSSPAMREPGVFGIFRPVMMLPEGMNQHLSKDQWEAILAHELSHVRCYDNLTAVIYMLVEAIFWFHPLVWWMGTRLVAERERACDEEVLRLGSEPKVYAEGILKVCELYLESPLECMAGVAGSNLRRRIRAIMTHRGTERMNMGKKLVLVAAGVATLVLPIIVGIVNTPSIWAQSPQSQSARVATPKFEVASIRSCKDFGPGERGANSNLSPGRMTLNCYVVQSLILSAYLQFANGVDARDPGLVLTPPIEGGPAWINSERYTINAKAEGDASSGLMQGPMLQVLLEERFKLKVHFETKGATPAYALTVAKGGSKMKPFVEGECTRHDPRTPLAPDEKACVGQNKRTGPNMVIDVQGITMDEFAKRYLDGSPLAGLDRRVVDRTSITGRFDIHLEYAPPLNIIALRQRNGNDDGEPTAPSMFTAIQEQLGLKLEPTKEPQQLLVIDHMERPSEN
jgi:uncharacterized protein (TIGR03435 family)